MIAGRYSLDREIGRGGMGVVWLGRDDVLGRPVALKRIDAERGHREAQLGARLQHPNVVAVFDLVDDTDGPGQWLVMEYVEGTTLAGLIRERGRLTPDQAAPLLAQAADALAAAHAAGITHRDVKPSNVLVAGDGTVKLSDFGIARSSGDVSLTQTGLLMGSPTYLAPEVASGARGDQAADVWSFGATAFHTLTGLPPYQSGDNPLSTLYKIVHDDPPRPLHATDAGWMAGLLDATLVKDPARRWSMAQVHAFLSSGGVQAERTLPTPPVRAAGAPRRWLPVAVLLGLALLVALGFGLHAALSGSRSAPASAPPAGGASPSAPARPTAAGMESFIRSYVAAVSVDPSRSWLMLTPKFQRESGGFSAYQAFWDPARNGRIRSIAANPGNLTVSYHVHFAHFKNGPGPTVLELVFQNGRYLIDGESTKGFVPAG